MTTRTIMAMTVVTVEPACGLHGRPELPPTGRHSRRRPFAAAPTLAAPDPTSLADLKWFEVFKDERLQEMIRTALVENYDLRDAVVARRGGTRQSRDHAGRPVSERSTPARRDDPAQLHERNVPSSRRLRSDTDLRQRSALNLLSFEVDVWGRLRRATEAARADLLASEENRKAVVTTLVSDVASGVLQPARAGHGAGDCQADADQPARSRLKLIRNREQGGLGDAAGGSAG